MQALAKDPQDRFASVEAFATALEQASQTARQFNATSPLSQTSSPGLPGTPHPLSIPPKVDTLSQRSFPPGDPISLPQQPSVHANVVAEQKQTVVPGPAAVSSLTVPSSRPPLATASSQAVPPLPVASPSRQPASYPVSPPPSQPTSTKQRRGLSKSKASMFIALVFLLVIGSAGLLYTPVNNYIAATHATATTNAYASATANAQATVTAAVSAYNTATANGVMFGFDAQHTHLNPYERVLNPTNVSQLVSMWTASTGDYIYSSPAVANGVVYVGSYDLKLYAFKASGCGQPSCSPLWTASTGDSITDSSPTVANGIVYIGSDDHKLYAFKASGCGQPSCSPLWRWFTGDRIFSSPAVANGMVYVGSWDGKLYAFHLSGATP